MEDKEIREIFITHKVDVRDDGFTERIIRQLPERKGMLQQIVMATFVTIGLALTFVIQGVAPFIEQINNLVVSISQLQIPSPASIVAYMVVLTSTLIIGFAMMQADAG